MILPLISLLFILGLASGPPEGRTDDPNTVAPGVASMSAEQAETMAREIMPRVEQIRGLRFKRPVPVRVVDDAMARAHFQSRLSQFWPEAQVRAEQTAYTQLGLLPAGADLKGALLGLLEEQAAGFYDPESDTFFVLGDMPRSSAPLTMAHELTHALDDQYYGIDAMIDKVQADLEAGTGVSTVVEGSGMLVMTKFLSQELLAGRLTSEIIQDLQESEAGRAEALKAAPVFLQRGLLSPYLLGTTFVVRGEISRVMQEVESADLDRLFRDPPVSSEQIIHPEKYWDEARRDRPREVTVREPCATLGTGWSLAGQGNLGEMNLAILTGQEGVDPGDPAALLPSAWTNEAAAGWGGDRWWLCSDTGGRYATLLVTLWDTPEDAAQFEAALPPEPSRRVARRRDALVLVAGDARDRAGSTAAALLDAVAPDPAASPR